MYPAEVFLVPGSNFWDTHHQTKGKPQLIMDDGDPAVQVAERRTGKQVSLDN